MGSRKSVVRETRPVGDTVGDVTHSLDSLVTVMESIAPSRWAQSWDNVGLLIGDRSRPLKRVMVTVDASTAVIAECIEKRCDALVAYHPVIFSGIKRITAENAVWSLVREGIGVYSPHTALDVADGGTNDVLADIVAMSDRTPLRVTLAAENKGLGRVGDIEETQCRALIETIKAGLGVEKLLVAGPTDRTIHRVAVGAGACGDLIDDALDAGAELYLTGELRHHDALRAAGAGLTVVAALHSNSERVALGQLAKRLGAALEGVEFFLAAADRDPFCVI